MALLFILPALIGFLVFYLYPTIRGFYFSLTKYNLLGTPHFIGFDNFTRLVQRQAVLERAGGHARVRGRSTSCFQTCSRSAIAVLMHRLTKSTVVRGVILLPFLISNVIAALVWFWLLDYQIGLVNEIIAWPRPGPDRRSSATTHWAIPTIAVVNVWRHMGYTALLVFAGLQTIPDYVYEAAAVDGSTEWRSFWRITLPLLRPDPGAGAGDHGDRLVPGLRHRRGDHQGRPGQRHPGASSTTSTRRASPQGEFGYACALSVDLFIILAAVALVQLKLLSAGESDLA